jgi:hypothetical protein
MTPLLHLKTDPGTPLSKTDDVAEERICMIQAHHLSPNPFLLKTSRMNE